ncbi:HsdM family class I SAM-dependent methyltransferase [Mycolicibacterium palauense]|uniref:HsdM family class I SAM-dependent methyltransferase n=1 Tax=Mycolicibacterium palauense TaxID=2034511 RepID=UPI000BFEE6C7|nr:N-6 DNA methylase [Mycolicibacterium palauense]
MTDFAPWSAEWAAGDTPQARKARGAFFTPPDIARYIAEWAIRGPGERVLEPSSGDASFLVAAADRLRGLGNTQPTVDGVEIHAHSARAARRRVADAGGTARIKVGDFFAERPRPRYSAVIGNPPYIRYQEFRGESRARSLQAALSAGVALSRLASSWAAFTVHAAAFLADGGRLGLVLPAELLSVNYAGSVRRFLFERFATVDLVLFDEQVFPGAEADVVLLLADGFNGGPSAHATIHRAGNAEGLDSVLAQHVWVPGDPAEKWVSGLIGAGPAGHLQALSSTGVFTALENWGDTTLGMVTGANRYFALSRPRMDELALEPADVLRLSPPGSAHLRGLALSAPVMHRLERAGKAVYLFRPGEQPSAGAQRYIEAGHTAGIDQAYKCRIRRPWYRVPLLKPADLLLTCMNADTPRLVGNPARAHHLNSVHGVYLHPETAALGRELLPVAVLNSATVLHAELAGRSYGGGILKLEPREADRWLVPSVQLIADRAEPLRAARRRVAALLRRGRLLEAVDMVDDALDLPRELRSGHAVPALRSAREVLASRRMARSRGRR